MTLKRSVSKTLVWNNLIRFENINSESVLMNPHLHAHSCEEFTGSGPKKRSASARVAAHGVEVNARWPHARVSSSSASSCVTLSCRHGANSLRNVSSTLLNDSACDETPRNASAAMMSACAQITTRPHTHICANQYRGMVGWKRRGGYIASRAIWKTTK